MDTNERKKEEEGDAVRIVVSCIRRMYPERLDGKSIYYMAQDMTQSTF